ncbi:MAG TPA: thiamine pyrophosphate-requiring protein [Verrucomicrobiae bacterium]|nr:thiamine pyrophosphate-requiring protein [Verrucomicrobiae bacterium]
MPKTASDFLVERLLRWGIPRIYGYPGDGINGVMGALNRARGEMDFIQTRHEELAAFMACAHARFGGGVGVCLGTSGPGAIHLLNGLYDAAADHQPVLAIVGQQSRTALGSDYQQEVDLLSLFKDVAHHYVQMAAHPAQVRQLVDRAVRIALSERAVTCIILPSDLQELEAVESPPRRHGSVFTSSAWSPSRIVPSEPDLRRAAEILNAGSKVAILAGAGALGAEEELMRVADILGAGVAKALLGKCVLPDDLPYVTGSIGLLGTRPSWEMMNGCDTLLMVGSGFPYAEFLPQEGQARGVQIDIKPRMLGARYPMELCLHGDSMLTLQALIPLLQRKEDRSWRRGIETSVAAWWKVVEARSLEPAEPVNPQLPFRELSLRLPDRCILTCDSGSAANWYAKNLKVRSGMMGSLSGNLATMCPGVPYALAAKLAHPDRPVIALVGDGAMQMLGNNALMDVARYRERWTNPTFVVLVLNNRDLNEVTWEQRVMEGDPRFAASQDLPAFSYAGYAGQLGLEGIEVTRPEQVAPAWERALTATKPVVIDLHCDPSVPPIPPHITFDQAKNLVWSLLQGDPDLVPVVKESARQMLAGFLVEPGRSRE